MYKNDIQTIDNQDKYIDTYFSLNTHSEHLLLSIQVNPHFTTM